MMEQEDPIKKYLFEYLKKNESVNQQLLSEQKHSEIIERTVLDCYDTITKENKHENIGVFATGLLHFLLTNALINSQRKINVNGTEIDIVIPDVTTLEKDPKKTLVIYITKTNNLKQIEQKIKDMQEIQPEKQNIWVVTGENINIQNQMYTVDKSSNTFSKIIYDIARFVNVHGESKFKILRI